MRRRTIVYGVATGLAALLVGLTLGARLGFVAVNVQRPEAHWFWYFSRAAGLTAYLALAAATIWGLLLSTAVADALVARARGLEVHRWLSAVGLALGTAHGVALVGDRYVAFDILDVLVPFLAPYRPIAVGLGIVALYLSLAVYGSFWLRSRLGNRGWRAVHVLSFPAFAFLTLHGMLAGTDSGTPWPRTIYLLAAGLLLWLTLYRLVAARWGRRAASAAHPAA
ncbi:MAG: ferric reductase-like transmembrane domain-containing protein [Chloroflexi bacterium]|nr:ferric reductase-like transmembrane domain-containing protein [Chloroflexota bacterium]